jgi:transcriptional regulator with XRE-family HTH domain
MKTKERELARELRRRRGLPIKQIARLVGVAPSSVSVWVRDVPLTARQADALRRLNPAYNRQLRGATRNAERGRERRRAYQEEGRAIAKRGDALHVAGVMLYWAEGDKSSKNCARISNSDAEVLRLFVRFLRVHFDIPDEKLRVTCHLFADHIERQREIEQYWLDVVDLPRSCLCKSFVNVYSKYSQKKRQNKLPYGTCRITVHSTRIIQSIFGAIQEYGGFERPEWLG